MMRTSLRQRASLCIHRDKKAMSCRLLLGVLLTAGLILASFPADGNERSLSWQELTVQARLDNDGQLHIRETHAMVFTGDWNGGERSFSVRSGQSLHLNGLYRLAANQELIPLTKGSLEAIDHYDWQGNQRLRWRSRLPGDPPFERSRLTYLIDYTLSGVIVPAGEQRFILNHDYAFPDRSGRIAAFTLQLTADDAWNQEGLPISVTHSDLLPGQGVVIRTELEHRFGSPSAVYRPAAVPRQDRRAAAPAPIGLSFGGGLFLLLVLAAAVWSFFRHESSRGRFAPLPEQAGIDEAWLARHVFHLAPETVGATWDKSTSSQEVAAILARLVLEKKLSSRLEPLKIPLFGWQIPGQDTLHLTLLRSRSSLNGYERALIDALFVDGDQTDTRLIRSYYRKKGHAFQPAEKIRGQLERRVRQLTASTADPLPYRWLAPLAAMLSAMLLLMVNAIIKRSETESTVVAIVIGVGCLIIGLTLATTYRNRSDRLPRRALLLVAVMLLPPASYLMISQSGISSLLTLGLLLLYAGLIDMVLLVARNRDSHDGINLCRQLAAARIFFST
jgi:hypothetical protein